MASMHMTKAQKKMEFEAQSKIESNLFTSSVRTAGQGLTKTDAQAAYGLRFGCSTRRRKAKEISFPTQVVPCQNMLRVDRNHRNKMTSRICQGAAGPVFGPAAVVIPRVARPPPWPPPSPLLSIYSVPFIRLGGFCLDSFCHRTVSPIIGL